MWTSFQRSEWLIWPSYEISNRWLKKKPRVDLRTAGKKHIFKHSTILLINFIWISASVAEAGIQLVCHPNSSTKDEERVFILKWNCLVYFPWKACSWNAYHVNFCPLLLLLILSPFRVVFVSTLIISTSSNLSQLSKSFLPPTTIISLSPDGDVTRLQVCLYRHVVNGEPAVQTRVVRSK